MGYKTIYVAPETYERLILYKHAGMTFDEVINEMMDMMSEEEFYEHVLEEHKKRLKKIKAGEYVEADSLSEALKQVWGALLPKYRIIYGTDYLKDIKKIVKSGDKKIVSNTEKIIAKLKTDPHKKRSGVDIKLISSRKDAVYRVRIGKYRMVYEIDEAEKKIMLTMIFLKTSDKDYKKK